MIITRATGAANLVGVAAYVDSTQGNLLLCDKIFRVIRLAQSPIEARFLAFVLGLGATRRLIVKEFSTESGMVKNVSKPALLSREFPLPPLDHQRALIAALDTARAEAARLRTESTACQATAWSDFEAAIYTI